MYYSVNENNELVSSESSDILPEEYQEIFPSEAPDFPVESDDYPWEDSSVLTGSGNGATINVIVSDGTEVSGDGSSVNIVTPDIDYEQLGQVVADAIDYDSMIEAFADVPSYQVFPNTSAVSVMAEVVNSLSGKFGYVIVSGSSSSDVSLYYSKDYVVNNKNITLKSPVTHCRYYNYRPSSSSTSLYTYIVDDLGDTSFNATNQLMYTNLLEGYPDLVPYKQGAKYSFDFLQALALLMCAMAMVFTFKARKDVG